MEYSKVKKDQIVLLTHTAKERKDKGGLVYVTASKVKGKVQKSKTQVRLADLNVGLGYNPITNRYEGCKVSGGWFCGKPIQTSLKHELAEDWDTFHCDEITPLLPIIKESAKKHQIIARASHFRVHLFRPVAQAIRGGCKIVFLSINTRDVTVNGSLFQLSSIDGKSVSDWIHFSSNLDPHAVERWMLKFKSDFLSKKR